MSIRSELKKLKQALPAIPKCPKDQFIILRVEWYEGEPKPEWPPPFKCKLCGRMHDPYGDLAKKNKERRARGEDPIIARIVNKLGPREKEEDANRVSPNRVEETEAIPSASTPLPEGCQGAHADDLH
jgi:hypothetical protein